MNVVIFLTFVFSVFSGIGQLGEWEERRQQQGLPPNRHPEIVGVVFVLETKGLNGFFLTIYIDFSLTPF